MNFAHTKIQRPRPRPGLLLPRPALERRLVEALCAHRAVLLCAPAGYGKTALLARALDQLPAAHAAAWVSLDPGDDLHRLLECLLVALEPFDPPWRIAPEGLLALAAQAGEGARQQVVVELVNALEACDVPHGVIALDDLHHVDDPACLGLIDGWLQRLGDRWTLAIAARHEPALRLARLRASGDLAELRQDQLQFDREEARTLLAGAGLDSGTADALYERTGGWAAGLRLALGGARGGPGSAMDRHAFDFLASEVLARIDTDLRDFLLSTSVLHDLDAARCMALTGDPRAPAWLDEIERLGLFASVVDEAPRTLRLHDLFRDALQHRLRLERGGEWLELLGRAADVETDTLRRQALLLAAQRCDDAAADLRRIGWELSFQGGVHTLLRLCDAFPAAYAQRSPELQQVAGMARWRIWDARAAERHLARAEALYAARGDTASAQTARGQRAVTLIGMGRLDEAGRLLAALREAPSGGEARVITLLCNTWHALENGEFGAVAAHFDALLQALAGEDTLEYWYLVVPAPRLTACRGVSALLGRWAAGVLAVTGQRPLPLHALALLTQGWQALWQGRVAEAAAQLRRADASAQWTGQHVIARSHAQALRALVHALQGRAPDALAAARARVEAFPRSYGDWGLWQMLFFACRIAATCGDAAALREGLQRMRELEPALPDATPRRLRPGLGLEGLLAWLEGRPGEAAARWREALGHEDEVDLFAQSDELRVRLALARLRERAVGEAAQWLQPVLQARDDGPRGAVFAAAALRELAAADWRGHLSAPCLATLREWAALLQPQAPAAAPAAAAAPVAAAPPAEGLTARELEVLAHIAAGASNKLIARALDLSPHTVKRHVAHILDKLALNSRGQAAAWYHARAGGGAGPG